MQTPGTSQATEGDAAPAENALRRLDAQRRGEMAELVRAKDWATTPLGPIEGWPRGLRVLVDAILAQPLPMIVMWGPSLVQIYNDGFREFAGTKHPGALGTPVAETWPEAQGVTGPLHDRVLRGESIYLPDQPLMLRRGSGGGAEEKAYLTLSFSPVRDDAGAIAGLMCVLVETTRQVESREARERAEEQRERLLQQVQSERARLANAFQQSPAFLAVLRGPDHIFEFVNERYSELTGRRELIGKPVREALPELRGQQYIEILNRVYASGEPFVGHNMLIRLRRRPEGPLEEVFLDFVYQPMREGADVPGADSRKIVGILVHGVDVSSHRTAEQELIRSTERLDLAQRAARMGVFDWDIRSGRVVWSEQEERIFGLAPGTFEGSIAGWSSRLLPEDGAMVQDQIAQAMKSGVREMDFGFRILRADGVVRFLEGSGRFIYGLDGEPLRMVGVNMDVTDRRQAHQAALDARRRYQAIFEATRDGLIINAGDGRIIEANPAACRMHGYNYEEFIRLAPRQFIHPDDLPLFADFVKVTGSGKEFRAEARDVRKDGTVFPVEVTGTSFVYQGQLHLLGVVRDITERQRSAERISRMYAVAAALTEALTTEQVARVAVDAGLRALGASAGSLSLLAEDRRTLEMMAHAGYEEEVIRPWRQIPMDAPIPLTDAVRRGEAIFLRSNEERLARYPALARVRGNRGTRSSACIPLMIGGKVVGVLGLSFDVACEFEPEDREFVMNLVRQCAQALERARLFEAEKKARALAERANDAKSEFLAVLSHELRTPLTPVLLTVSLMETNPALPDSLRDDVATIKSNVELESRLIGDLLDLTRIAKGKLQLDEQDVDLHLILRSAIAICQREASARLVVELNAKHANVRGDSTRLQQIFWNLISNAQKFTPPEGIIVIRSTDAREGWIRVEVSDSGAGIDPAVLPRLFTAFEQGEIRTLRQQAGLGLGLAISKRLTEAHGGTIAAASAGRDRGATFTVELPVVRVFVAERTAASAASTGTVKPLSVLLVEDHAATLKIMSRLLAQLGHRVSTATTAAAAIAAAQQQRFDLLISDLGLPDGSGLDVMRELKEAYAGRAIALTGYGMESDVAASREAGFAQHLTKPVDLAKLQWAIAQVTGG